MPTASTDWKYLAGGMTLIPALKMRLSSPGGLVDLGDIAELRGITLTADTLTLGAMTRHAQVVQSPEVSRAIPALSSLAAGIGDPQVRNRGTLGGSIANNDPAADYPAALVALGATVHTNKRTLAAESFFRSMFETALEPGEMITKASFPIPLSATYEKFKSPASRYALVGVFVAITRNGVRVAITGAGPCVFRALDIEKALAERFGVDALENLRISTDGLNSDIHADAKFRAHLIGVLTRRAVATLAARTA